MIKSRTVAAGRELGDHLITPVSPFADERTDRGPEREGNPANRPELGPASGVQARFYPACCLATAGDSPQQE